jgi:hypothetical protein
VCQSRDNALIYISVLTATKRALMTRCLAMDCSVKICSFFSVRDEGKFVPCDHGMAHPHIADIEGVRICKLTE